MRMSRLLTLLVAGVLAAGVPLLGGTLGQAQTLPTLTVNKVVTGAVPPGTTFTVGVVCAGSAIGSTPGATGTSSTTSTTLAVQTTTAPANPTITFNAQGDPTTPGSNVVSPPTLPSTCTVTETANGGAQSTSYACTVGPGSSVTTTCPTQQSVSYNADASGASATITITNVFPAAAIVAAPQFTG